MATVLGFGASAAGVSTPSPGPPAGAHGRPPRRGTPRPTVGGKVTAVSGNDVIVQTRKDTTTTVVVSSATTYKTATWPGGTSSAAVAAAASALKVGDFIAVHGTEQSDGTVTASSIVISTGGPPGAPGGGISGSRPPAA